MFIESSRVRRSVFTLTGSVLVLASAFLPITSHFNISAALIMARPRCKPLRGLSPFLKSGNVLLFGELHGTQQAPAFVADVVCAAAKKRMATTLALEIPFEEQSAIDRYLASNGDGVAQSRLTEGQFWHPESPDGRSSVAMLQLIERARVLRVAGAKLRVITARGYATSRSKEVDRLMGQSLIDAAQREANGLTIVLAGNFHTRLTRGLSFDQNYEPMGFLLARALGSSRVISLDMSHDGGEAWGCRLPSPDADKVSCAPYLFPPQAGASAWSLKLDISRSNAFNGTYGVGRITASPPVKGSSP